MVCLAMHPAAMMDVACQVEVVEHDQLVFVEHAFVVISVVNLVVAIGISIEHNGKYGGKLMNANIISHQCETDNFLFRSFVAVIDTI